LANVVLISTYELGRQPFGVVSPAAWLRSRGHEVACFDLTRQSLDDALVRGAQLIALYLPMHTATRLAAQLIPALRERNPGAHLCCYGLYAPMNADYLRSLGCATILGGEFEAGLVHLAERLSGIPAVRSAGTVEQPEPIVSLERLNFEIPDRTGMPPLEKYANLVIPGDGHRIVPVYKGAFRIVSRDVVMADVRQQVAAGAQHISFGDPDFFNGIRHAMDLVEQFHAEFPKITYDVTIKIEHLRKHEAHLPRLRDTGCLFVISAVESVDDEVLNRLDKGHTRADFVAVVQKFRELGMILHPTFVPFTPWTTTRGYLDLLTVLRDENLAENVAPVQLGIRLLIPEGSRLLELDEVRHTVAPFDAKLLVYPWNNDDARLDTLSETVQAIAADADRRKQTRSTTFAQIWQAAHDAASIAAPALNTARSAQPVPFLSEPWYCCAEPTADQLVSIGTVAKKRASQPEPITAPDRFV
jgi:hypothetical protein